ncbi:FadR/GntR family transcriptional regulator [Granulosicoccus sp. 3-233]|uniref:FadR/GntR family transcriptional regulator n=1 Tax=Granulosicoccus sp. 3-233 TaxID=3417969 RepID=UPI003D358F1A
MTGKSSIRQGLGTDTPTRVRDKSASSPVELLRPLNQPSLDKSVINALIVMIEKAQLKVGDRLPPEQTLASRLGVGRSTIREALKAWQSMGIVTRNKGAGTILAAEVTSNSVNIPITLKLEAESLLRTNGVRRPLEVEAIRLACGHASQNDRDEIQRRADILMEVYQRGEDWRKVDSQFHSAVHKACGNPLFGQLSTRIHAVFHDIYKDPFDMPLLGEESIPVHRQLADAISAADTAAAVQYMLDISQIVDDAVRKQLDEL